MSTALDDIIRLVSNEKQHLAVINDCFIYFAALAETRYRGTVSELFEFLPPGLQTDCNDETALHIHNVIVDFIEHCPSHPNVGASFRTLLHLKNGGELKGYLIEKLKFYYAQRNAGNVFQICIVLEDLGEDIFRDENGVFIMSRSSCDYEINLGVAGRYLGRLK
jgi:hypothetical protein